MAIIKKSTINAGDCVEKRESSCIVGGNEIYTATMEDSMEIPLKLGIKPPYDPAIPLLGMYPEETKIEKDTYNPMFTATLFTIARTWQQPRCPLADK